MLKKIVGMRFSLLDINCQKAVGIYKSPIERQIWLEERISIFNTVTYPSLSQHENIEVTIFFGHEDEWAGRRLLSHTDRRFTHIYTQDSYMKSCFMRDVPIDERCLVTRMDSDDAIASHYFDDMDNEEFLNKRIVQPKGVLWNGSRGVEIEEPNNQFITVYTNRKIHGCCPLCDEAMNRVYLYKDKPSWLTYVHGRNVANRIGVYEPYLTDINVSEFGILA